MPGHPPARLLYDAGRRKAQVDYAVAQREQATALYREQVLSAFRDVEDQLSALRVLERGSSRAATRGRCRDAEHQALDCCATSAGWPRTWKSSPTRPSS